MTFLINGQLEIDRDRGVIYFHVRGKNDQRRYGGITILRICNLPTPIPVFCLDITHMRGQNWDNDVPQRCIPSVCSTNPEEK